MRPPRKSSKGPRAEGRSTTVERPPGTSEHGRGRKRNLGRERVAENAGKPRREAWEPP